MRSLVLLVGAIILASYGCDAAPLKTMNVDASALLQNNLKTKVLSANAVNSAAHAVVSLPSKQLGAMQADLAMLALHYSTAAYCSNASVATWTCKPCKALPTLANLHTFYASKTSTFGYAGIDNVNKYIVVAFQGSHNLKEFIDDLEFVKTDLHYPGAANDVRVHSGFYNAYEQVQSVVEALVSSTLAVQPSYTILVTGHSLGGALAAMCSLDLSIKHPHATILHYTFGQPRVGNKAFSDFFRNSTINEAYRFVHNRDLVPHLPLEAMGFYHIATEVFYLEEYTGPEVLHVCNGSGEDPKCSDQFTFDISISDHLNYLGQTVDTDACS
eukprot:m.123859 g.123859  ORF g.123859 m.123859 type:complete len:328 (+) comp15579_c2_seq2:1202-2185(+)